MFPSRIYKLWHSAKILNENYLKSRRGWCWRDVTNKIFKKILRLSFLNNLNTLDQNPCKLELFKEWRHSRAAPEATHN